jgi:hypothetical protein
MYVVGVAAVMSIVWFTPGFPWTGLLWVGLALSASLWMLSRTSARSTAQVIWDVEAEPVPALVPKLSARPGDQHVDPTPQGGGGWIGGRR